MNKPLKVEIPRPPNFIKVGTEYMPLTFFSDLELKAIARQFGKSLIARKKQQVTNTLAKGMK